MIHICINHKRVLEGSPPVQSHKPVTQPMRGYMYLESSSIEVSTILPIPYTKITGIIHFQLFLELSLQLTK